MRGESGKVLRNYVRWVLKAFLKNVDFFQQYTWRQGIRIWIFLPHRIILSGNSKSLTDVWILREIQAPEIVPNTVPKTQGSILWLSLTTLYGPRWKGSLRQCLLLFTPRRKLRHRRGGIIQCVNCGIGRTQTPRTLYFLVKGLSNLFIKVGGRDQSVYNF